MTASNDPDNPKEFALEIASGIYDSQLNFDWDTTSLSFNLGNGLQGALDCGDPQIAIRYSEVESIWRQIAWTYDALHTYAATANGFAALAGMFEEPPKKLGMKVRFQREFEGFLFRLFSFRERLFHLSNAFHARGLTRRQIRGSYWDELLQAGVNDEFVDAVTFFLADATVAKWLQLRNEMTHNFELSLVGIGWAPLGQLKDENGQPLNGIALGQAYDGSVNYDLAVSELRLVFESITTLLRRLDAVLLAKFQTSTV